MSDRRLRDLQRRWLASESADDLASYLSERMRVGDLSRKQVEILAYCGRLPGEVASELPDLPTEAEDIQEWASGLDRWGVNVTARAGVAAVELIASLTSARSHDAERKAVVAAAKSWVAGHETSPTTPLRAEVMQSIREASDKLLAITANLDPLTAPDLAGEETLLAKAIRWLAAGDEANGVLVLSGIPGYASDTIRSLAAESRDLAKRLFKRSLRGKPPTYRACEDVVRLAVVRELTSWILQSPDPTGRMW